MSKRTLENITQQMLDSAPLDQLGILNNLALDLAEDRERALKTTTPGENLPTIDDFAKTYGLDLSNIKNKLFTKKNFELAINTNIKFAIFYDSLDTKEFDFLIKQSHTYEADTILYALSAPKTKAYYEKVYRKISRLYITQEKKINFLKNVFQSDYATSQYFKSFGELGQNLVLDFLQDEDLNDIAEYQNLIIKNPRILNYKGNLIKSPQFLHKFILELDTRDNQYFFNQIPMDIMNSINEPHIIKAVLKAEYRNFTKITNKNWHTKEYVMNYLQNTALPNKKIYSHLQELAKILPEIKKEEFYNDFLNSDIVSNNSLSNFNKILSTKFWTKYYNNQNNFENYLKFLTKRISYNPKFEVPIVVFDDMKNLVSMCEKYKAINLDENIKNVAIYNKEFILYYMKKITTERKSQNLANIQFYLPPVAVKFFESVDIKEQCYDFIVSFFEKKRLENTLTPNKNTMEIIFKNDRFSNFVNDFDAVVIKAPEEIVKKETKRFKL